MLTNILVALYLLQPVSDVQGEAQALGFSLVRESLVVIPVLLNSRGPSRFLLDTRATHSILSKAVAKELNLPIGKSQTLITAVGPVPITVCSIEEIQIGGIRINQALLTVSDADMLRTLHVDGIIGADYLKGFTVSIDYTHRLLSITHSESVR
jgi:predicted aspartyl protease